MFSNVRGASCISNLMCRSRSSCVLCRPIPKVELEHYSMGALGPLWSVWAVLCLSSMFTVSGLGLTSRRWAAKRSSLRSQREIVAPPAASRNIDVHSHRPYTTVCIVPTGIGARIGGYAGDALPVARLLARVSDRVITHPNVLNGAMLYWPTTPAENLLYVEGHALNEFAAGRLVLQDLSHRRAQRIGVILDSGMERSLIRRHVDVCDAMRASLGIHIQEIALTAQPVGVHTDTVVETGAASGRVDNLNTLLAAAQKLKDEGCTALAVVTRFPEDSEDSDAQATEAYLRGEGVDCIAGAEAVISAAISAKIHLPVAHAPAFAVDSNAHLSDDSLAEDKRTSPKACAEELGFTYLPCLLANLHRAPNLIPWPPTRSTSRTDFDLDDLTGTEDQWNLLQRPDQLIHAKDVDAVVLPADALGGPATLSFLGQHMASASSDHSSSVDDRVSSNAPLIIAVEENHTVMHMDRSVFSQRLQQHILIARSYCEAAGIIAAHKHGLLLDALTDTVPSLRVRQL